MQTIIVPWLHGVIASKPFPAIPVGRKFNISSPVNHVKVTKLKFLQILWEAVVLSEMHFKWKTTLRRGQKHVQLIDLLNILLHTETYSDPIKDLR